MDEAGFTDTRITNNDKLEQALAAATSCVV